ncbi:MAG: serine/threonine protein kinase [Sandaracinaceae bacterium]|nr:serine/threonine protein kinase [Sandaracinaceae bacterium]
MATARSGSRSGKDSYLGRVVAGRYRLEALLGEGGMGVVYRARHVLIDRVVALKLIRPDLRGETHLRAWMLREARAANRVDHAHIVEIHDVGETEEGELYLVMEYLTGTSLSSEVAKGQLPLARAVDILEQMTAALSRAHDLGVVHRDLKSDNIMLTVRGGRRDFVKILDFGLAALARDPRLAPKGAVFGTPEYMSPEQARGDDAIPGSDLYALGILFFEMLTGQLPFRSSDRDTLLEMQRSSPPPRPTTFRKDMPEAGERIILRLLEKDPRRRFRDGHHLAEELKALQRTLPSTTWEVQQQAEPPPAAAPPPPAPTPGVVEWSRRAAYFARMVARAYPERSRADRGAAGGRSDVGARRQGEPPRGRAGQPPEEARGHRAPRPRAARGDRPQGGGARRGGVADAARRRRRARAARRSPAQARGGQQELGAGAPARAPDGRADAAAMRAAFEEVGGCRARAHTLQEVIADHQGRVSQKESAAADPPPPDRRAAGAAAALQRRAGERPERGPRAHRHARARGARLRAGLPPELGRALRAPRDRPECADLVEELRVAEAKFNRPPESSEVVPAGNVPG